MMKPQNKRGFVVKDLIKKAMKEDLYSVSAYPAAF
jgi:hypothetical protein